MYSTLSSFEYFEPRSLQEAVELLATSGPDSRVLAGGCDLLPEIRRRQTRPVAVINIARVPGLARVTFDGEELRILPMASLRAVERHPDVRASYAALYDGVRSIASVQVKTTGTLVGNLCVATPASDVATPLMVLNAELRVLGTDGLRITPIHKLFAGVKRTSLMPGELVAGVRVPLPPSGTGSAFAKLVRTAADIAKINAAVRVTLQDDVCADVRIALGAVAPTPVRAPEAEALLVGSRLDAPTLRRAAEAAVETLRPIDDLRSTAEYRRRVMTVLLTRVVGAAADRARGGDR